MTTLDIDKRLKQYYRMARWRVMGSKPISVRNFLELSLVAKPLMTAR